MHRGSNLIIVQQDAGDRGSTVVKVLCYKSEGIAVLYRHSGSVQAVQSIVGVEV